MIQFPCHCGFVFKLPEDMAGAMVQCPRCKKLADVPTLTDLPHLNADGTYTMDTVQKEDSAARLQELDRAFGGGKVDQEGEEIDMRPTRRLIRRAGAKPPRTDDDGLLPGAPKYDPLTGELVMPLDFSPEDPVPVMALPVPGASSIGYATRDTMPQITPRRIFIELFMPANMVVMFFVYLFHLFSVMSWIVFAVIFYRFMGNAGILVAAAPTMFLLLGHYANTVEENGPEERDELPRPLRHMSWTEDLWNPFIHCMLAIFCAYTPLLVLAPQMHHIGIAAVPVAGLLLIVGNLIFPAAFLTATTSGSIVNFRPDRMLRVITQSGSMYLFAVLIWTVTGAFFAIGTFGNLAIPDALEAKAPWISYLGSFFVRLPMLMLGVYSMHYFCWLLGFIWRVSHNQFNWESQEFIHTAMRLPDGIDPANSPEARRQREMRAEVARQSRKLPTR